MGEVYLVPLNYLKDPVVLCQDVPVLFVVEYSPCERLTNYLG